MNCKTTIFCWCRHCAAAVTAGAVSRVALAALPGTRAADAADTMPPLVPQQRPALPPGGRPTAGPCHGG